MSPDLRSVQELGVLVRSLETSPLSLLHSLEVGPYNLHSAARLGLFPQGTALLLIVVPGAHRNGKEGAWPTNISLHGGLSLWPNLRIVS